MTTHGRRNTLRYSTPLGSKLPIDWNSTMLGYAHAAGVREGLIPYVKTIARYFCAPEEGVVRAASIIESAENPAILLLQNPRAYDKVGAAVLFSSVWSKAYSRLGNPYGRVHRDFHYQVMFAALAALVEVGCNRMRIDNPMSGLPWRTDAYVCLQEVTGNIRACMGRGLSVWLREGEYDPETVKEVDTNMSQFDFEKHRPIGMGPYIFEGMNMRTVFVEKAARALRMSGVRTSA